MNLTSQLVERTKEVLLDGKWIAGTNIKDQIKDLDWKQANAKIESLNTISDLVFHINYYIEGVANAIEDGKLGIKDKYSFDAPLIKSEKDWKKRVEKFCDNSERFVKLIEKLSDKGLNKPFIDEKYGNYLRNIDAILEHSYYHFGQIVMIKKLLQDKDL